MTIKLVTVGVYGFDEAGFFQALQEAQVDTLCDIRQRRGVRGAAYAFANSRRLQAKLAELGVRYLQCKELAPTGNIRQLQKAADSQNRRAKRQRRSLSPAFVAAYQEGILARFDSQSWLDGLPPDTKVVALCCVEREPLACHRSLLAGKLEQELGLPVEHIVPL
jgi:hypothetical protein